MAWEEARAAHLIDNPLCGYCAAGAWGGAPRVEGATLVDHLYPHRGDRLLFWARQWWVSCCTTCHSGPKQAAERSGLRALHRLAQLLGLDTWKG